MADQSQYLSPLGRRWRGHAMNMLFWIAALATGLLMPAARAKADYEVMTRNDIFFAERDGVKLFGDLYAPKSLDKAPVLVAVHGGGCQCVDHLSPISVCPRCRSDRICS